MQLENLKSLIYRFFFERQGMEMRYQRQARLLLLLLTFLQSTAVVVQAQFSAAHTQAYGLMDWKAEIPLPVTVQAYDFTGSPLSTGGETIYLSVDETVDNIPTVPQGNTLTDNGDGTYSTDLVISGGSGDVTVTIQHIVGQGLDAEYFSNTNFSGTPITRTDSVIYWNWGSSNIGPLSNTNYASVRWTGAIKVPTTGTYDFQGSNDDTAQMTIGTQTSSNSSWLSPLYLHSLALDTSIYYPLTYTFVEQAGSAYAYMSVNTGSGYTAVPASYFWRTETFKTQTINIAKTTVPDQSTIQTGSATTVAGLNYLIEVQSRNAVGVAHTVTTDIYTVTLPRAGTQIATHQSSGLYETTFVPTVAGLFTMTIELSNDYTDYYTSESPHVNGSPMTVRVYPGQVDPIQCYLAKFQPKQTAGVQFSLDIQFVDLWANLHYLTMTDDVAAGMTVYFRVVYDNHDTWESPIDVDDSPANWKTVYGTTFTPSASDNNDGTMSALFTINRAGDYIVTAKVNNVDIYDSPYEFLTVEPNDLYLPNCVPVDAPMKSVAGFTHRFIVQGRDLYHNNVHDTIEGVPFEVLATFVKETSISVDGKISDIEDLPGIYVVEVDLPETIPEGDYTVDVSESGSNMPTTTVYVYSCSVLRAFELGLVSSDSLDLGQSQNTSYDYLIGSIDALEVQVPIVPLHCETHQPVTLFKSAVATTKTFEEVKVTQTRLLTDYGISLHNLEGSTPTLLVTSQDHQLDGTSVTIELTATVREEPDWQVPVAVTVNFLAEELAYEVKDKTGPRFDPGSVSGSTLQLIDDGEVQFLAPVFLVCDAEWSKKLPQIEGESEGTKFQVSVDLDMASTFLKFNQATRQFTFDATSPSQGGTFTVKLQIKDVQGNKSSYDLRVNYDPCQGDKQTGQASTFVPQYDENPPTPVITSIDQYGEVKIRFNETMRYEAALNQSQSFKEERRLADFSSYGEGEVVGSRSQTYRNFSSIHTSSVLIDNQVYPSVKVSLLPADSENTCSDYLDFSWELKSFSRTDLTLQLYFKTPSCISGASSEKDVLEVAFFDQRLFVSSSNKMILPETVIKSEIVRQMSPDGATKQLVKGMVGTTTTAVATTGILGFIFGFVLKGALRRLLNVAKSLQIILHIMLIQVFLVSHTESFVDELQGLVLGSMYDRKIISGLDELDQVDDNGDKKELRSSPIGVGPVTLLMFGTPVVIGLIYLCSKFCPCLKTRAFCRRQQNKNLFNRLIFFFDGSVLLFFVSSIITIMEAKLDKGVTQLINYHCSTLFVVLTVPTCLFLFGYLIKNRNLLDTEKFKDKVGAAYSNLRIAKDRRSVLTFMLLSYARRIALGLMVTLGRGSMPGQLLFINFSSLCMIVAIAEIRPYLTQSQNILELINEFSILVLVGLCITQTEFVLEPQAREAMGWSLNTLIIANIALNLAFILSRDAPDFYRKMKHLYLKKRAEKRQKLAAERQKRINQYREKVLKEFERGDYDDDNLVRQSSKISLTKRQQTLKSESIDSEAQSSSYMSEEESKRLGDIVLDPLQLFGGVNQANHISLKTKKSNIFSDKGSSILPSPSSLFLAQTNTYPETFGVFQAATPADRHKLVFDLDDFTNRNKNAYAGRNIFDHDNIRDAQLSMVTSGGYQSKILFDSVPFSDQPLPSSGGFGSIGSVSRLKTPSFNSYLSRKQLSAISNRPIFTNLSFKTFRL